MWWVVGTLSILHRGHFNSEYLSSQQLLSLKRSQNGMTHMAFCTMDRDHPQAEASPAITPVAVTSLLPHGQWVAVVSLDIMRHPNLAQPNLAPISPVLSQHILPRPALSTALFHLQQPRDLHLLPLLETTAPLILVMPLVTWHPLGQPLLAYLIPLLC